MDGEYPRLSYLRSLPLLHGFVLTILISALLLTRLSCPLLEPEEARYAEIPRQMLAEGQFAEPVLHGQPYYHKPPLLYWLVMLSYSTFGVHDWAARLVPALASVGTVLVTWLWGRRVFGPQAGFWGALVLILSGRFVYLGRMLTIDPLLTLWVTAGLAAAHLAMREERLRWQWWLASALLAGLGLLTKGPVALALTLVPVTMFQMLNRHGARPSVRASACYIALAVAIASPWYVAMAVTNPEAAADFFWLHNVQRFVDPLDHAEPWWFFLPSLLWGTLPWSVVIVPALWQVVGWAGGRGSCRALSFAARQEPRPPKADLGFALLCFGWCVLFFSLSGCKRAVYILPAFPWLAVCLGCYLSQGGYFFIRRSRETSVAPLGLNASFPDRSQGLTPLAIACRPFGAVVAAVVFVVLFFGVYELLPRYHREFGLRGQVRRHSDDGAAVFCYPKRWDSVSFYLQRGDVHVFGAYQRKELMGLLETRPGSIVFVKERMRAEFLEALPPQLEFVEVGRQSARVAVGVVRPRGDLLRAGR